MILTSQAVLLFTVANRHLKLFDPEMSARQKNDPSGKAPRFLESLLL
jgi:hypothetical protein